MFHYHWTAIKDGRKPETAFAELTRSRDFLAGATVRADYESVRNTIDCPERVYGLLGSEPLATSDQTNLVVRLMHQTKRPRSLLLILVPN